jgi:hypothetical protein
MHHSACSWSLWVCLEQAFPTIPHACLYCVSMHSYEKRQLNDVKSGIKFGSLANIAYQ